MRKILDSVDNFVFGNGYQFKQDAPNELNYQQLVKTLQQREELANHFIRQGANKDYGALPVSGWAHVADALSAALGMYMKTAGMRKTSEAEQAAKEQAKFYQDQLGKQQTPEEVVEAAKTFYPERDLTQEYLFTYKDPTQVGPEMPVTPSAPAQAPTTEQVVQSILPNVGRSVNRAEGGNYLPQATYSNEGRNYPTPIVVPDRNRRYSVGLAPGAGDNLKRIGNNAVNKVKQSVSTTLDFIGADGSKPGVIDNAQPKQEAAKPVAAKPVAAQPVEVQPPPVQPQAVEPTKQPQLEDVMDFNVEGARKLLQSDAQSRSNFVRDALRRQEQERQQIYAALEGNPYAQSLLRQRLRDENMQDAISLYRQKAMIDAEFSGSDAKPKIISNSEIRVDPKTGQEYYIIVGGDGRPQRVDTSNINSDWQIKKDEKIKTDESVITRSKKAVDLADKFLALGGGEEAGAGFGNFAGGVISSTGLHGTNTGDTRAQYEQLYSAASSFLIDEMNALGIPVARLLDGDREAMRQIAAKLPHPDTIVKMSPRALNEAVIRFRTEAIELISKVKKRVGSGENTEAGAPAEPTMINGVPRYQGRGQTIRPQ